MENAAVGPTPTHRHPLSGVTMSPITRRSLLASAAGLSTLGLLSACGGSSSSPSGSAGPVTLSFTFWGPVFYQNFTKQMVDLFMTKQPNIKIESQPSEWSGYWDKLATMVAGKATPDVINMDGKYIADYGGRGVLMDLSNVKGLDLSSLSESDKQAGTWGGSSMRSPPARTPSPSSPTPASWPRQASRCRTTARGRGRT